MTVLEGTCSMPAPLLHPGGTPRVIDACDAVDTDVDTPPDSVIKKVSSVGEGTTVGMAEMLR